MAYQRLAYGLSTNPEETRVEYLQRAISENNVCHTHTHTETHISETRGVRPSTKPLVGRLLLAIVSPPG